MELPIRLTFSIKMDKLYLSLQSENKRLIMQTIQKNTRNNEIKIPESNNCSSCPYHSPDLLTIVLGMNN